MATLLELDEAKAKLTSVVRVVSGSECSPLSESLGRRLSKTVTAPMNLPPFASSAMDGYAFKALDGMQNYRQVGEALAGHPYCGSLNTGECVRIFTGAMMPEAADTVIPQENVEVSGADVRCLELVKSGQYVRPAGLDVGSGEILAHQGSLITPSLIGLLSSAGFTYAPCRPRIRITLLTTGDELITPPNALPLGCIYESNLPMLQALLDPGIVTVGEVIKLKDNQAEIEQSLKRVALLCDVIISTGGISVGATDYVAKIMQTQGQLNFWRIALKPGMPMAFGRFGSAWFFGLPGNPVSTVVTLNELVNPFLIRMAGGNPTSTLRIQAKLEAALVKSTKRTEFQRGRFICSSEGAVRVTSIGDQASNRISSLTQANCFIVLDGAERTLDTGESVLIQPFFF